MNFRFTIFTVEGVLKMKRDWSLLRVLLAHFESESAERFFESCEPKWIEGQLLPDFLKAKDEAERFKTVVAEHLKQLLERNLVEGVKVDRYADNRLYVVFTNPRLTSDGYDLLEAMRSDSVWKCIRQRASELGVGLTVASVQALARSVVRSLVGDG